MHTVLTVHVNNLIATGTDADHQQFTIMLDQTGRIFLSGYNADYLFKKGPFMINGQWHSITLTYNGSGRLSLYINDALVETTTVSNYGTPAPLGYNTVGDNNWLGVSMYALCYFPPLRTF